MFSFPKSVVSKKTQNNFRKFINVGYFQFWVIDKQIFTANLNQFLIGAIVFKQKTFINND